MKPKKRVVRIPWAISIGLANAKREGEWEVDSVEWSGMTPSQQTEYLDEALQDEISNYLDAGYEKPILP